ncbi:hypothetical protein H312_00793 [Anncaliia algerae PRA339]|uniref:Uncharacterized protein n=1 Tax=Anncaliia algerae PRA339 TaxID=1288291 RepID=A0A059F392_9MICR|nr:hypothetical protein H312_00793 [Anncaliia algerae PRA339]
MRMYRKVKINFINLKLIKVEKYKDFLFFDGTSLKRNKKIFYFFLIIHQLIRLYLIEVNKRIKIYKLLYLLREIMDCLIIKYLILFKKIKLIKIFLIGYLYCAFFTN